MIALDILTRPEYGFLRLVFVLSAIASVTFGLVGSFVVARRIGYLSGAISHCAFGGIGFGLWLKQTIAAGGALYSALAFTGKSPADLADWVDPVLAAVITAVGAALILGIVQKYTRDREDALIGILWSVGMAVGLLFLSRIESYVPITAWLFGDITLVSSADILTAALLAAAVCLVTLALFRPLEAVCFDPEFARLRGLSVDFYYRLLLVLVAVTVILMIRIVGMVLVIAMLTIPPSAASRLTGRLGPMILGSILICFLGSWGGILLAVALDFPAGPMIIVVVAAIYFVSILLSRKR